MVYRWLALGFLGVAVAGCNSKLETGYEPLKLGAMTPTQRRGLYSENFTPEARAAEADKPNGNNDDVRRTRPGGAP